jgi:hypothetical protein
MSGWKILWPILFPGQARAREDELFSMEEIV